MMDENETGLGKVHSLTDQEKREIQLFSDRLDRGEVSLEEIQAIENSLSPKDTKELRMMASTDARAKRKRIRETEARLKAREDRKMKNRCKKNSRRQNRRKK